MLVCTSCFPETGSSLAWPGLETSIVPEAGLELSVIFLCQPLQCRDHRLCNIEPGSTNIFQSESQQLYP